MSIPVNFPVGSKWGVPDRGHDYNLQTVGEWGVNSGKEGLFFEPMNNDRT